MNAKHACRQPLYGERNESQILDQIVDAMLEVALELQNASTEEWGEILVNSCRRHKRSLSRPQVAAC